MTSKENDSGSLESRLVKAWVVAFAHCYGREKAGSLIRSWYDLFLPCGALVLQACS